MSAPSRPAVAARPALPATPPTRPDLPATVVHERASQLLHTIRERGAAELTFSIALSPPVRPEPADGKADHDPAHGTPVVLADGTVVGVLSGSSELVPVFAQALAAQLDLEAAARQSTAELAAERRALADAERIARTGSFEWHIRDDRLRWSDELCRIYGVAREDFEGNLAAFVDRLHPDDRDTVGRVIADAIARGGSFEVDERIIRADGQVRLLATSGQVLTDALGRPERVVGVCRDMTEQRALEEALAWAQHRFRILLEHSSDIVSVIGSEGLVTYVAGATERVLGVRAHELVGGAGLDAVHVEDVDVVADLMNRLREEPGASGTVEYRVRRPDGQWRWLESAMTNMLDDATLRGFVVNTRDVTERKAAHPRVTDARPTTRRDDSWGHERIELELALAEAVARRQVVLHYQPIVDLRDEALVGFEALLRLPRPDGTLLSPAVVIPVAEDNGLIVPIGAQVIQDACTAAAQWAAAGVGARSSVSVNLSARQVLTPTTVDLVEAILAETGLDAGDLCLELTETALVTDQSAASFVLSALKDLGVRIALDDFGTGYASFDYLRRFPVDVVKIDRSFVAGLSREGVDRSIVAGVVHLAQSLGLTTVAEGVEDVTQLEALRVLGCDLGQGYLWSAPMPPADVPAWSTREASARR